MVRGSEGSSCPLLCWLLEGRCKPGKEGPGGDGGERWGCSASTFKIFKLGGRSNHSHFPKFEVFFVCDFEIIVSA